MDMGTLAADSPQADMGRGAETTAARGSGADMGMVMGMGVSTRSVESWWVAGGAVRAGVVLAWSQRHHQWAGRDRWYIHVRH